MTPSDTARAIRWGIVAVILIAAFVVGMWQIGWWFHAKNVSRDAQVNQSGYANQSAMRDEINRKIADVQQYTVQINNPSYADEKKNIEESRSYAAQLVCGDAAQLNSLDSLPAAEQQWITTNCVGGSLSATSKYHINTTPGE